MDDALPGEGSSVYAIQRLWIAAQRDVPTIYAGLNGPAQVIRASTSVVLPITHPDDDIDRFQTSAEEKEPLMIARTTAASLLLVFSAVVTTDVDPRGCRDSSLRRLSGVVT